MTDNEAGGLPIDYVELSVTDTAEAQRFYGAAFGWTFDEYPNGYVSFRSGSLYGGFQKVDAVTRGGPLVVLYTKDLESVKRKVREAGGEIVGDEREFPGGRRFHFLDPSGNELAVWSDV